MPYRRIHVYDIDGVLVDTSHRYRNKPDGTIDIDYWIKNRTAEKLALDTLLPHATQYRDDCNDQKTYTILCTSRVVHPLDITFIRERLGLPNHLLMRPHNNMEADDILKLRQLQRLFNLQQFKPLRKVLWEDNPRNIDTLRKLFTKTIYVPSHITGK